MHLRPPPYKAVQQNPESGQNKDLETPRKETGHKNNN